MTAPTLLTSFEELQDFLANPHAHEELDEPLLVVELPEKLGSRNPKNLAGGNLAGGNLSKRQDLATSLRALPAVTVLLTEDAGKIATDLVDDPDGFGNIFCFDIITDNATGDLEDITETVLASPQASVSLVQLLRAGETMSVRDALMAESWVYSMLQGGNVFQSWLQTQRAQKQEAASPAADTPAVLVEDTGDTLYLTLNRPERRNAFNAEMRDTIVEILRAIYPRGIVPGDIVPGDIVLKGAGEAFCSGGDLTEFGTTPDSATAHIVRSLRSAAWEMHLLRDHIRVDVHGACVGAGIELPAFTNNITSTPDAFFWLPEVRFGLVPGAGGTVSLPRRIGRHRTAWLSLTNRRLSPPTALEWGLVDAITP